MDLLKDDKQVKNLILVVETAGKALALLAVLVITGYLIFNSKEIPQSLNGIILMLLGFGIGKYSTKDTKDAKEKEEKGT